MIPNIFGNNSTDYFGFGFNNADELEKEFKKMSQLFNETHIHHANPFSSMTNEFSLSPDELIILQFQEKIIPGFLNLGKAEGWGEGGDIKWGFAFARCMLNKFYSENKNQLGIHKSIVEKAIHTFTDEEMGFNSYSANQGLENSRPKSSRACCDLGVNGWEKHAISRMVGNLASQYQPSKPFFEILINSAHEPGSTTCNPFTISIFNNENELDERRKKLCNMKMVPSNIAHFTFYPTYLKTPEAFLKENSAKIGPNGTHILKGLQFLQNKTINAQKVGNCWMKQPQRCILVAFYLEILSADVHCPPEKAWSEAVGLYKNLQKSTAIPYVEKLLKDVNATPEMISKAQKAINERKQ